MSIVFSSEEGGVIVCEGDGKLQKEGEVGEEGKDVTSDRLGETRGEVHDGVGDNDPNDDDKECLCPCRFASML